MSDKVYRAAVITASDKGAAGLREDVSGETYWRQILRDNGFDVVMPLHIAGRDRTAGSGDEAAGG